MDPISIAFGLAQFAPAVIKWITGSDKAEEAAQKVVDVAKVVTGRSTGEEALEELKVAPDKVLAFRQQIAANELEYDRIYLADRQDARKRDAEFLKAGSHNWRADILAALAVGGLVLCVWMVARDTDMPERAINAIMFVAGVLAAAVRDVYSFEFGSSRSSHDKTEALVKMLHK
jgi:K+-sensing histidine kinase KdpD